MKENTLLKTLLSLKGNAKACIFTEPLVTIPNNLYTPFITIYMVALSLSDKQIGLIASISLLFRALSALLGGAITDKFGRRITTFLFDIFAWSIPCLLWMNAQNFMWFAVAASLNGMWQITDNSWTCLLVEDDNIQPDSMSNILTWVQISGQLAVFFSPMAAFLIGSYSVIFAMKIMYLFAFLCITAKALLLFRFSKETRIGVQKAAANQSKEFLQIVSEYKKVFLKIFLSRDLLILIMMNVIFTIATTITTDFFPLYVTDVLGGAEYLLAYFPIIRSAIILVFFFLMQTVLKRQSYKTSFLIGIGCYMLSHVILLWGPKSTIATSIIYTILEAVAHCLVIPRKDSALIIYIAPQERARMHSIITTISLLTTMPFVYLAGVLSDMSRKNTFIFNLFLFLGAFLIVLLGNTFSKRSIERASITANQQSDE